GVVVGEAARRQLARNAARTVYSVKRLMGRGYEDVKDELPRLPFVVTPPAEVVAIRIHDRAVTPPPFTPRNGRPPGTPAGSPASTSCASSTSPPRPHSPTDSSGWRKD